MSRLGAQRGQVLAVHADHSENIGRCQVRSQCQLARKSSKRVQTGEPKIKTPGWIRTRSYSAYLPVTDIPTQPFAPALHCVFAANFGRADKPGVK